MAEFSSRRTLALTADGDIRTDSRHRVVWVKGEKAVIQGIKTTLLTVRGEDPFDEDHGLDVFAAGRGDEDELRALIVEAINDTHGDDVREIDEIEIEMDDDRYANVAITLTLITGSQFEVTL